MKILMTGMSSSHCSVGKNISFFSTLYRALSEFADVTICDPKLSWTRSDLQKFDAVFVGLTPPTAISANKIYGALHVLDLMYESPKLRLVVDSPQVWQYKNSIESFKKNPSQIFKSLYASRKDYSTAISSHKNVASSVADKMKTLSWPRTYVPTLPWNSVESLSSALRFVPADRLVAINLDSYLLGKVDKGIIRRTHWAVDNIKSDWWKDLSETLTTPGTSMVVGKRAVDADAEDVIASAIGVAISPQDRKAGTWWSYRYIQGLNMSVPIATYWQDLIGYHEVWTKLAYQIEDMEPYERQHLADSQYKIYESSIPDRATIKGILETDLIGSTEERI
jgi:hypothetical protein